MGLISSQDLRQSVVGSVRILFIAMESTKQTRGDQDEERQFLIVDRVEVSREEEEEPDGGWGWIVVLACFLTTFTLDGN